MSWRAGAAGADPVPDAGRWGRDRCKLLSASAISLSDVLPTFEHLGAKVVDERPYEITPADADPVWIYDLGCCPVDVLEEVGERFTEAFLGVWSGRSRMTA